MVRLVKNFYHPHKAKAFSYFFCIKKTKQNKNKARVCDDNKALLAHQRGVTNQTTRMTLHCASWGGLPLWGSEHVYNPCSTFQITQLH